MHTSQTWLIRPRCKIGKQGGRGRKYYLFRPAVTNVEWETAVSSYNRERQELIRRLGHIPPSRPPWLQSSAVQGAVACELCRIHLPGSSLHCSQNLLFVLIHRVSTVIRNINSNINGHKPFRIHNTYVANDFNSYCY